MSQPQEARSNVIDFPRKPVFTRRTIEPAVVPADIRAFQAVAQAIDAAIAGAGDLVATEFVIAIAKSRGLPIQKVTE